MSENIDQNPAQPEELVEETPATPLSREELWEKLTDSSPKEEVQAGETPKPVKEVVVEAAPVEEKADPPVDPLANDPKLAKRFRDSQAFIATLKDENKELSTNVSELTKLVEDLRKAPSPPAESSPTEVSQEEVDQTLADLMKALPESVRDEVNTFPELFKGIDALVKHRLTAANKEIEGDIQDVRKQRHEKFVQQKLNERHQLADQQLGITNSAKLDLDDPVFAQWVLSSPFRKQVVLDFENSGAFVDLVRSFLFDYPDQAARKDAPPAAPQVVDDTRRKAASHSIPSRPVARNRETKTVQSQEDKLAYWQKLVNAS